MKLRAPCWLSRTGYQRIKRHMASSLIGTVAGIVGAVVGSAADPVGRSTSLPASLDLSPDERRRRDERQSRQQRRQRPVAGVPVHEAWMPVSDVPAPMLPPPQQAEPMPVPPRVSLRGQLDQCMAALQNSEFRIAVLEAAATTQHQRLLQCETELQLYRGSSPIEMQREVEPGAEAEPVAPAANCDCISRLIERAFLSREDRSAAAAARRRV